MFIKGNIKNIHQCFHLIYFLLYYMGCLGCKIQNTNVLYYDKRYNVYGNIYRFMYLIGLMGGFLYKTYDEELNRAVMGQLSPVIKGILIFECIICPITYVTVTFYLDWHRGKYIDLANTLQTLDDEMQRNIPDIQWNYQKSARKYNLMTLCLYGYYTVFSTLYIFNVAHCTCGWVSTAMISICYACVTGAPAFACFLFISYMDFLRLRFRLIQKLIRQYLLSTHVKTPVMDNIDASKLKLLENYFKKYCNLIIDINEIFCMISGLGLFHDFAVLTSLGYLLCSKALSTKAEIYEYVSIILFMVPRTYKTVIIAIYGYQTQRERQNCFGEFVRTYNYFKKSSSIQQQMENFFHWHMQNTYEIRVGKILKCNLSLIFLTLNSVVNYVMILVQLQFQQNNILSSFINEQN